MRLRGKQPETLGANQEQGFLKLSNNWREIKGK